MTKTQSLVFRVLLFLAGAGIIALAFFLLEGGKEIAGKDIFMWISIGIMYLAVFCPFFFLSVNTENFSGKIPSLILIWLGVFLYTPASVVNIVLLKNGIIPLNASIVIQAALLFLFLLDVYFGYFASAHAVQVAAEEDDKRR
jgi:hypothetical protein